MIKLEKNFCINGNIVEILHKGFMGYDVYQVKGSQESSLLYFIKEDEVMGSLYIDTGMFQGCGYLSELCFDNIGQES